MATIKAGSYEFNETLKDPEQTNNYALNFTTIMGDEYSMINPKYAGSSLRYITSLYIYVIKIRTRNVYTDTCSRIFLDTICHNKCEKCTRRNGPQFGKSSE